LAGHKHLCIQRLEQRTKKRKSLCRQLREGPVIVLQDYLIPNIKGNPRNRKAAKRGRKRLFNAAIHTLRLRVERTFAWEDKFKRLLLRFEHIQQRHYGMKLLGYTMINLRAFCGV
jgi:transposase